MASFEVKKFDISTINGGQRYENGQVLSADTINKVVEAAAYAQQIEAVDDDKLKDLSDSFKSEVDKKTEEFEQVVVSAKNDFKKEVDNLSKEIPLLAYAPYNVQLSYQQLLGHYNNKTDVLAYTSDFSKTPRVGEEFSALIKTSENYVTSIKGEITNVDEFDGYVSYKIISFVRLHSEDTYEYKLTVALEPMSSASTSISFYSTEDNLFTGVDNYQINQNLVDYLTKNKHKSPLDAKKIYGLSVNSNGEPLECYIGMYCENTEVKLVKIDATIKYFDIRTAYNVSYSSKEEF